MTVAPERTAITPWHDPGPTTPPPETAAGRAPSGELLDRVESWYARFVAYPSENARVAHVLWTVHTHLIDRFESTPRMAFLSPEAGSGKSRALEVSEPLVPRPVHAVNVTPAYLFRKVSDPAGSPTILFDEIDTVFGAKAKDNEDLRGLLNAGHRKGATAGRCVVRGRTVETEELPAYAAVAVAGLGDLPDTIMTRSIVVRMRRRTAAERVEAYRPRVHATDGRTLHDELAIWATEIGEAVEAAWPSLPEGIEDRAADVWEPLLAIADAAGGDWPERARVAAVALVAAAAERPPTLGVRLLEDLRRVFLVAQGPPAVYAAHLPTTKIIECLCELDESPWMDLRGKQIDATRLARILKPYGVAPKSIRIATGVIRGYTHEDLHDPWTRYLPSLPAKPATAATNATTEPGSGTPVAAVASSGVDGDADNPWAGWTHDDAIDLTRRVLGAAVIDEAS